MKKITGMAFLGIALLGFSLELWASFPIVIKSVVQKGNFMPPRPTSRDPLTEFVIEVERCRNVSQDQFDVKFTLAGGTKPVVEIVDLAFDCFGPTTWQEVRLQTNSLPLMDRVAILNPVYALVEDRTTH